MCLVLFEGGVILFVVVWFRVVPWGLVKAQKYEFFRGLIYRGGLYSGGERVKGRRGEVEGAGQGAEGRGRREKREERRFKKSANFYSFAICHAKMEHAKKKERVSRKDGKHAKKK